MATVGDATSAAVWVSCAHVGSEQRQIRALCERLGPMFKEVNISEFSSYEKNVAGQLVAQSNIVISSLKAGRIKVTWCKQDAGKAIETTKWYRVQGYQNVWVARRNLQKAAVTSEGDFEQKRKDVASVAGVVSLVVASPVGRYTKKAIREGALVSDDMFQEKPLIAAQADVDLVLKNSGVQITGKGTALTQGMRAGDVILVKFRNNPQTLKGVVVNESSVLVDP